MPSCAGACCSACNWRVGQGARVVLSAIPGQCHELELLVAGVLLASSEIALTVLPLGQPLAELTLVCEKLQPQLLVLFSNHPPAADFSRQLGKLALALDCPVGGSG